jgi:hypothetical protein
MLYIGFFGVYLLLSGWLTDWAARKAKARGIAGWKWGLPMALLMYHLVFWDWVPTVVAHQYYCSKYGGFTVYKTLKEWKAENPGVAETLVPIEGSDYTVIGNQKRYTLNQRFAWNIFLENKFLRIKERDEQIVDIMADEILSQYIDFSTDIRAIGLGPRNIRDYKIWLKASSCEPDGKKSNRNQFSQFQTIIEYIGR